MHGRGSDLVGPQIVGALDAHADKIVPDITSKPSWPTLRARLLALAAETGEHPLLHLQTAAAGRELYTAVDMAAVLEWRLPEAAPTDPGPGIPEALHDHHVWAQYLAKRCSSSSSSQLRLETAPAKTANSRYGHRQAATRAPVSSVKLPSGVPPSASTPKTADRPEQANYKRPLPFGNRTSTEPLPYAATAPAQMQGNARLEDPLQITSAKIDIVGLQHALFVGVPRPDPACELQCRL